MSKSAKSFRGDHQNEPWFRMATRSAAEIRKQCGIPDSQMEERIVRVFRSALRPRKIAGRKPDSQTSKATNMWIEGMQRYTPYAQQSLLNQYLRELWQTIYVAVFPEFDRWDKLTKQYETGTLRRNVKACLRRQGRKLSKEIRVPTSISKPKRVLSAGAVPTAK